MEPIYKVLLFDGKSLDGWRKSGVFAFDFDGSPVWSSEGTTAGLCKIASGLYTS